MIIDYSHSAARAFAIDKYICNYLVAILIILLDNRLYDLSEESHIVRAMIFERLRDEKRGDLYFTNALSAFIYYKCTCDAAVVCRRVFD